MGKEWIISDHLLNSLEKFVCCWYITGSNVSSINKLRYDLFCIKQGEIESHNLPPCKDCLKKHAQRANYQTSLWKTSLVNTAMLSSLGMGWKLGGQNEENELEIDWMDGQPAPKAVLDLLACNCSTSCKLNNCSCKKNGLKCTKMCKKKNCKNQARDNHLQELNINDESLENGEFPGFSENDFWGF